MTPTASDYRKAAVFELRRRAARAGFAPFVLFTTPNYKMGWVHREICETLEQFLQDVRDGKSPRLMISMPPRSGKSELVSRKFPAYAFGVDPDLQIIATSYGADMAQRFNRDVQRVIDNDLYHAVFPETSLNKANVRSTSKGAYTRTSDLFEIVGHTGSYRSCGVGGGITGMGADILIIDDPVKDRKSANSATVRQSIYEWYTSTAYTRLSPGGGVIVMCTRWHVDDLLGIDAAAWPDMGIFEVSQPVYSKIAYRDGTEGIVAEIYGKEPLALDNLPICENPLVIVTEAVEKPGNIGAILRSADACGADALIICNPKCDLYNPNLIRASIGAIFTVPTVACTSQEAIGWLKDKGIRILTAQLQDSEEYYDADMKTGCAIVLGSEDKGLGREWREAADCHIRIPMSGKLDSLNVSVSAAVLLFEALRQRRSAGR